MQKIILNINDNNKWSSNTEKAIVQLLEKLASKQSITVSSLSEHQETLTQSSKQSITVSSLPKHQETTLSQSSPSGYVET